MKRQKKYIFFTICLVCVLTAVVINRNAIISTLLKNVDEVEEKKIFAEKGVGSGYSKDGNSCYIVQPANEPYACGVNETCFVFPEMEGIKKTVKWPGKNGGEISYLIFDKFQLDFYKYGSNELKRTIDLSEVVNNPDFPYYITSYSSRFVSYDGEWCMPLWGYRKPKREMDLLEEQRERFYINLNTFEIYPKDENHEKTRLPETIWKEKKEKDWKVDFISQSITLPTIWENNGMNYIGSVSDYMYDGKEIRTYASTIFACEDLPKKEVKIYEEFPGLEKYRGKEGYNVRLMMFDVPTNEEFLSYFLDEVFFEGMVLDAKDSIDGQRHEINSIDDYYMYRYGVHEWDQMPEDFEE